jgi:hypothetical protein
MAEATQFQFDMLEVAKILLKHNNITEGFWTVGVQFTGAGAEAGPANDKMRPSLIVSVDSILLTKSPVMTPLTIDAASLAKE